jgi:type IV fimbrial biogenesis protein FimT
MRIRHCKGFTLVELMVSVAVFVILLVVAIPSLGPFLQRQRVKGATMDIAATVVLARSEAIKRNAVVTVTSTTANSDWSKGWAVTAGTDAIRSQTAMDGISVIEKSNANFSFSGDGRLQGTGMAFTIQSTIAATGQQPDCITVGATGRVQTTNGACL